MTVSTMFFSSVDGSVRFLSASLHPFEIIFFRNILGLVYFVPWIAKARAAAFATNRLGLHTVRLVAMAISMTMWFTALSLLPLAEAIALNLTTPLFAALGAILFLRERSTPGRWFAILMGLTGAILVVRPGFEIVSLGATLALVSAVLAAISKLLTKILSRTDSPATIVLYQVVLLSPVTLIPAVFVWQTPSLGQFAWLAFIASMGTLAMLTTARSYKVADVTAVEPVSTTRVIWAALVGYLAFAEVPDIWTWAGASVIILSVIILARVEGRPGENPAEARAP